MCNMHYNLSQKTNHTTETIAIGIDLGTTYSCVGLWDEIENCVKIIETYEGEKTVPSWISFDGKKKIVGKYAKMQRKQNINNTIYDIKRLMGRQYDDPLIQKDIKEYPYQIKKNKNEGIEIQIHNKKYTPEEL